MYSNDGPYFRGVICVSDGDEANAARLCDKYPEPEWLAAVKRIRDRGLHPTMVGLARELGDVYLEGDGAGGVAAAWL